MARVCALFGWRRCLTILQWNSVFFARGAWPDSAAGTPYFNATAVAAIVRAAHEQFFTASGVR